MFVFGIQYLRGATPERENWKRDLYNIKQLGFNTVRAWLVWNAIERSEGEIDHEYIHDFLGIAEENGLDVGLLFHMHACPAWAVQKYSRYFYVNEDGLPFEPAVRPNTPSGGWPGLCFDHPEAREMEKSFIEKVIAETKKHKSVAFYEPMNEPHQWVDLQKNPRGIFCYCPATTKKFQVWLAQKYGSVQELNRAWGHFYGSFEEVRPPRWTASYCDYMDFRLFTMDNVAEEIAYRTAIIKSCDNKPVIAHAWGGGAVTCTSLGAMAFDDWKNAAIFDKWGYSAFPQRAEDCAVLGLGCDSTRCAANGKDYWQSELTAGMVGTGLRQYGRISDQTFDKFSLESIRHGAKGLLYWQYRKERIGAELGGFALTDNNGETTNLTKKAADIGKLLRENGKIFEQGAQAPAEVALVFSIGSYLADWCSNGKKDNKFAVDSISGYYRMLWEENITVDILHESFAHDLGQYKVIILPSPYAISPAIAQKLKQFVYDGGLLISDPYVGAFDEDYKLSHFIPGLGLDEVFGCRNDDLCMCEKLSLYDSDGKSFLIEGNMQKETYRKIDGDILYRYEDGNAAVISKQYGKGRAVICGVNLGLAYSSRSLIADDILSTDIANASAAAREIVLKLCEDANIRKNPCSVKDIKISLITMKSDEDTDLLIMINSAPQGKDGTVSLDRAYRSVETVYGKADVHVLADKLLFSLGADESTVIKLYK